MASKVLPLFAILALVAFAITASKSSKHDSFDSNGQTKNHPPKIIPVKVHLKLEILILCIQFTNIRTKLTNNYIQFTNIHVKFTKKGEITINLPISNKFLPE